MPINEARNINIKFIELRDSITFLKHNVDTIISDFTRFQIKTNKQVISLQDRLDSSYLQNKRIIDIYQYREKDFYKERLNQQIFTIIVGFVACIFAFK